jgi:hypothetical protein
VKDAKLALGDASLREAEAHVQAVKDNAENGGGLIDTLKDMLSRSQEAVKGNESYNKVYDDLVGQQLGIGTERGTAERNAQLVANAFRVMGERSGVDPFELYSNYNLKLARPMDKALTDRISIDTSIDPMLERLRAGDVPKESDVHGPSLLDTLRETGLKDSGGELAQMEVDADRKPFQRKVVRDDGMELDKAREMLVGKGYLTEGSTVNDLLDAIDNEMRGGRVSSDQYRNSKLMDEHLALTQLQDHLDRMGVDVHKMSNEEIRKALTIPMEGDEFSQSAVNHLATDGVRDLYQSASHDRSDKPVIVFKDGVNQIDITASNNIEKGTKIASLLPRLDVDNLFDTKKTTPEEAVKIGTEYYRNELEGHPVKSPAFNGEEVSFTDLGLSHILGEHERALSPENIARRMKLLAKAREVIANATFADEVRVDPEGNKYGLLGVFKDGTVLRVVVQAIERDGKVFLTTYDWKEVGKKLKQSPSPELLPSAQVEGVGEAPPSADKIILYQNTPDVKGEGYGQNAASRIAADEIAKSYIYGYNNDRSTFAERLNVPETYKRDFERTGEVDVSSYGIPLTKADAQKAREAGFAPYQVRPAAVGRDVAPVELKYPFRLIVAPGILRGVTSPKLTSEQQSFHEAMESQARRDGRLKDAFAQAENTPYYQESSSAKRGYIRFDNARNFEIGLLKDANLSTFIHESGHFFTEVLGDLAERPDAPQQVKDDYATLLKFAGVDSRDAIQTEHHEKLARAFEAYIMEGKAPSVETHGIFQRMKAWMIGVYKDLAALNVELNPEVRDVFDRMLATDSEIERMRDMEAMKPLFATAEDAGMSQAEFELYRKDAEQAGELAKEQLLRKLMAEKDREQKSWWKAERKKTWAEVEAEAKADPIYQTYQVLTTGKTFDGRDAGDIKLSRADLVKQYGEAFVKSLPREFQRIYAKEGGLHPDAVAEMAGFGSGDEMVRKMAGAPKMKEYVKAETDRRMRERYGDMMTDGSIHEQALNAVHNDAQGKVMRAELLAIQRKAREVKPFVDAAKREGKADADATARWYTAEGRAQDARHRAQRDAMLGAIPPVQFFKITASETMGLKRVAEIQPHLYAYAARSAARESFEAAAKRNYQEAGEAKYRELLNHYLYKEAVKARDFADKVQAYAARMGTMKELGKFGKAGGQFLDQIRAILDRYSFDRISNREALERLQHRESLDAFLNRMKDEEGVELPIPDAVRQEIQRTNYRNLSMDELRGVYDSMRMLEHAARQVNQVNAEGRKVEITQAALSLSNRLFRSVKGEADMERKSDGAASLMDRVKAVNLDIPVLLPEFMFERFDGLKKTGPWHEFIWDRYNDAADHQIRLREMLFPRIMEYAHAKAIDRSMGKIHIDAINADLVKDDIIAIALNCGNESNLDKLMRGGLRFKGDEAPQILNHVALQEILSHLSAKEIAVVNGIWKTIDSLKPEAAELARKRTGVEPNWIKPLPMEIKNGTLEGGYYPVKYDPRYSAAGEKQSDSSTLDQMFNKYAGSSTRQGYMKERTSFAAPLSLDWQSIVSRHLDEVITDISHWQFATDTQRLLKRPEIKDAIHERLGAAYYKNLLDWVRYTVNQDNVSPEASDTIEKFRRQIRSNMSTYVLGFKVANAVNELAIGVPLMMQQVRIASAFKGIMQYLRNPVEATRFANQASDHMRNVDKSFDRDIAQALNTLVGQHSVFDDIRHWSIASRTFFWKIGAVMAWHAGYIDAQEQGLQGKAAIRIADSIYRMTQESGRAGDLSAVQRNPYMKELTQFIGPSLIQYNNNRRAVMAFKDQGFNSQTAALGLTTLLAGHVANALIFDLLRGKQPGDPDKLPAWILARLTLGLFDGIPAMRDIAEYAESRITGEKGKEPRLSPVLQWGKDAVDGVTKTVNAAAGNVDWNKAIIQDAKTVGGATGLPTLAGSTVGQYIYDVLSGDYRPEHSWSPVTDVFYNRLKK